LICGVDGVNDSPGVQPLTESAFVWFTMAVVFPKCHGALSNGRRARNPDAVLQYPCGNTTLHPLIKRFGVQAVCEARGSVVFFFFFLYLAARGQAPPALRCAHRSHSGVWTFFLERCTGSLKQTPTGFLFIPSSSLWLKSIPPLRRLLGPCLHGASTARLTPLAKVVQLVLGPYLAGSRNPFVLFFFRPPVTLHSSPRTDKICWSRGLRLAPGRL